MTIADLIDDILNLRIDEIAGFVGGVVTNVWAWMIVLGIAGVSVVMELQKRRAQQRDAVQGDRRRDALARMNRESRGEQRQGRRSA